MRSSGRESLEPVDPPRGLSEITGSLKGAGRRFALVVSRFNEGITSRLVEGAVEAFIRHGVARDDLEIVRVPGAFELPPACKRVAERGAFDGVVALGCVIRGETPHFEYVAEAAATGLGALSTSATIPVVFGVLTTDNLEQALARAGSGPGNKGWDAALTALEMANLFDEIP